MGPAKGIMEVHINLEGGRGRESDPTAFIGLISQCPLPCPCEESYPPRQPILLPLHLMRDCPYPSLLILNSSPLRPTSPMLHHSLSSPSVAVYTLAADHPDRLCSPLFTHSPIPRLLPSSVLMFSSSPHCHCTTAQGHLPCHRCQSKD